MVNCSVTYFHWHLQGLPWGKITLPKDIFQNLNIFKLNYYRHNIQNLVTLPPSSTITIYPQNQNLKKALYVHAEIWIKKLAAVSKVGTVLVKYMLPLISLEVRFWSHYFLVLRDETLISRNQSLVLRDEERRDSHLTREWYSILHLTSSVAPTQGKLTIHRVKSLLNVSSCSLATGWCAVWWKCALSHFHLLLAHFAMFLCSL